MDLLSQLVDAVGVRRTVGDDDRGATLAFVEHDVDDRLLDGVGSGLGLVLGGCRAQGNEHRLCDAVGTLAQCRHDGFPR